MLDDPQAELREFFQRMHRLAPSGFVTRMLNACHNDGITSVNQLYREERLTRSWWLRCPNLGRKTIDHLYYLLKKYAKDFDAEIMAREFTPKQFSTASPAGLVRWIVRDGEHVLQYCFNLNYYDTAGKLIDQKPEWRDVPTEIDDSAPPATEIKWV